MISNMKPADWSIFETMDEQEILDYVDDENHYPQLFMELSHAIYSHAQKYRSHQEYNRVWGSSVITDAIANSILQSPHAIKAATAIAN